MAVRKYKPTTPGRRGASVSTFEEITRATNKRAIVTLAPGAESIDIFGS